MSRSRPTRAVLALCAAGTLVLAGCTAVDDPGPEAEAEAPQPSDEAQDTGSPEGPQETGAAQSTIGHGVTEQPCPAAVNPDTGCISLGVLPDLTGGPFAALAVPITDAQRAY